MDKYGQARALSGLPPALVITAEYDPLRDQGEALSPVITVVLPGTPDGPSSVRP